MKTKHNIDHVGNMSLTFALISTFALFGQRYEDEIVVMMLADLSEFTENDVFEALTWCKRYVSHRLYFADIYKQANSKYQSVM